MNDLRGKVGVVTGAASGIGLAVATALCEQGMKVALADVEATKLDAAVAGLTAAGHEVLGVPTDVREYAAIEALAAATLDRFGAVHVVHNNAGVVSAGPIEELSLETWDWVLKVDLFSVIYGIKVFLPLLKAQGEGHIISTASTAGLAGNPGIAPYNAAKFAVVGIMDGMRQELDQAGSPVGCSVLCPGAVNTQIVFSDRNRPAAVAATQPVNPVEAAFKDRAGSMLANQGKQPSEVADMVVDAVLTNRFWIVTHPGWYDVLRARVEAMAADGHLHLGFGG